MASCTITKEEPVRLQALRQNCAYASLTNKTQGTSHALTLHNDNAFTPHSQQADTEDIESVKT